MVNLKDNIVTLIILMKPSIFYNAIKNKIPENTSYYLQEGIKRLIILNYKSNNIKKENYETVYSKNYKTFCRKLNKKLEYYKNENIIFIKLNPYGNIGYKARILKNSNKEYNKNSIWIKTKNNFWI